MSRLIDTWLREIYQLGQWEWFAVLIGVLIAGVLCMRGFGSRTEY